MKNKHLIDYFADSTTLVLKRFQHIMPTTNAMIRSKAKRLMDATISGAWRIMVSPRYSTAWRTL
jgi:hypothetical protein